MTTLTTPATPAEVIDRMEQRLSMPHPASDTPPIAFEAAAETKFMPAWETDVLVIGAGPAGIAAATAAAQQGRAVLLLDDNAAAGGQIWREGPGGTHHPQGKHAGSRAKRQALQALHASGARIEVGSRVFDQGPGDNLSPGGIQRRAGDQGLASSVYVWRDDAPPGEQCIQVRYRSVIIATGARERFLPFPGWTLPGVYGAGGLQALVKGGYSVAGRRVIVAGSGPLLMAVAAHLRQDGARLVSIAEQASLGQMLPFLASLALHPGKIMQALRYRLATAGSPYRTGCWPVAALGDDALRAVRLTNGSRTWEEPCDLLAYGFHLVPNTEVAALLGCRFSGAFVAVDRAQQTSQPGVYCAGEPTGIAGLEAALLQGRLAGLAAAGSVGSARRLRRRSSAARTFGERLDKAFQLRPELATLAAEDTIVCRCEDVRYGQLRSHHSWTEAKLQTRCGMGPCQGRVCGPAVETLFGWKPSSIRPPLTPVPAAALCSLRSGSAPSTNQSLVP